MKLKSLQPWKLFIKLQLGKVLSERRRYNICHKKNMTSWWSYKEKSEGDVLLVYKKQNKEDFTAVTLDLNTIKCTSSQTSE